MKSVSGKNLLKLRDCANDEISFQICLCNNMTFPEINTKQIETTQT